MTKLTLTADQETAAKLVEEKLLFGDLKEYCLKGFAGTGKTWLIQHILQRYYDRLYPSRKKKEPVAPRAAPTKADLLAGRTAPTQTSVDSSKFVIDDDDADPGSGGWGGEVMVVCAAPTNKAVDVLKNSFKEVSVSAVFMTLHQYLGLKPVVNERTGEEEFVPDPRAELVRSKLLVVDEGSMVNLSLYGLTTEILSTRNTKILWVGDPAQLPPVKEDESPIFSVKDSSTLREVVRYGGDIAQFVLKIRQAVESGSESLPEPESINNGVEGVFLLPRMDWLASLHADFKSADFRNNTNHTRAIAWTNKVVDIGNTEVHRQLYGDNAPQFVEGQLLVAKTPVIGSTARDILMSTSDECVVVEVLNEKDKIGTVECAVLKVVTLGEGTALTLSVLTRGGQLEYERSLGDLRRKALNAKGYDRSKAWKDFYAYKNLFADLVPGYWSTVHKAQGSTFAHAYVFFGDICRNPKVSERNRMVYTAYTRAAKKLLIAH
jgi:exodeoxyribonuclease-5